MKFYTKLPSALLPFFEHELKQAKAFFAQQQFGASWHCLERAHILGQPYPIAHSQVHWQMLLFGLKTKNAKEIFGQLPRLFFGGVKSFVGKIPIGNTGGANVHPLQPMPVPEDLAQIIAHSTGS